MQFSFYKADATYCDFLRKTDPCVPYTMNEKENRPFVGIIFQIKNINYYAPLTSPKPKHIKMKNQVDFLKINNGIWGAINFNNMIPIHISSLKKIDINIRPLDTKKDRDYKNLLMNQLSWCNSNKNVIINTASHLYKLVVNNEAWKSLLKRCCNFTSDEYQYRNFCMQNNLQI